jgi:glycosyltransferase involved in cell wall biosynthesis
VPIRNGAPTCRPGHDMPLRILHTVELYQPSVGGAQEVVRQISERLVTRGHEVTVATARLPQRSQRRLQGVTVAEFDMGGNDVRGIVGDVEGYRRFVTDGQFDVVMMYAAQQWATDALLPVLDAISAAKILAPCGFSALHRPEYASYFEALRGHLGAFDGLIFHSNTYQDIRFARDAGAENPTVIPNGADEREFGALERRGRFRAAHGVSDAAPLLLSVGSHTGLKGHAKAMATLRTSGQARRGVLAIVGNTPTKENCLTTCRARATLTRLRKPGRRIALVNPPRPGVLDAYADADLFLCCSAIECSPLVLFEAMASGLPFVSLDVGNAAEIVEWSGGGVIVESTRGEDGLVTARTEDVARAVDDLLADEARRAELGESGRRAWEQRFSWDAVTTEYERLYETLAA